jgi:hypothetical protein
VLAVSPVVSAQFPAAVTATLNAKLVELVRDSGRYEVFDQGDIETVLRMQKQGASPVIADPVAFGRLVAARKVLTTDLQRSGDHCTLGLKITDVETGLIEAAKVDVGECALPVLLRRAGALWRKLIAGAAGRIKVSGAPLGAEVYEGNMSLGALPLDAEIGVGRRTLRIETDAGSYARIVTVSAERPVEITVLLPFTALQNFERQFVAANQAGRDGNHSLAAARLDEALQAGVAAMQLLPPDMHPELSAALLYVEGARSLAQAWELQKAAQAGAETDAYCSVLETAGKRFAESAAKMPRELRLDLSANWLAKKRQPLKLGICAAEARLTRRLRDLRWLTSLDAQGLANQATLNRSLVYELKQQTGLNSDQRAWLAAEEALLRAFEKWAAMTALKGELLKSPSVTLPQFCALQRETLGFAATAAKRFEGVRGAEYPLAERIPAIEDIRRRAMSEGTLCP